MVQPFARQPAIPFRLAWLLLSAILLSFAQVAGAADAPKPKKDEETVSAKDVSKAIDELLEKPVSEGDAISTANPQIDPAALEILLKPLSLSDLRREMKAWDGLLQEAVKDLSVAELELFQLNAAQDAVNKKAQEANPDAKPTQTPEQKAKVKQITTLREQRTAISDRFKLVLDEFEAKGGDPDETKNHRAYVKQVGGVEVDTQNARTAAATMWQWVIAEDGGIRLLRKIGLVLLYTVIGAVIGWIVGMLVNLWLHRSEASSVLMRRFLHKWIVRVGILIGFLVGLSHVGTNMTPILAGLGALGFILAFALQSTISNFASGLLIMFLRPFDAGDEIEAAGEKGKVKRMTIFSTYLTTDDGEQVIIPNNKIWEDVITNRSAGEKVVSPKKAKG